MNLKETINITALKQHANRLLRSLEGDEVLQIIQRNQNVKVAITQDHYLYLLNSLRKLSDEIEKKERENKE